MKAIFGFIALIFLITLFMKKWKVAGVLFLLIVLVLMPIDKWNTKRESNNTYQQALTAFEQKDYDKAEELFDKVDKSDDENYNSAQAKIKEINQTKADSIVASAQSKFNNSDFDGAKKDLEQALALSPDYTNAKDLLANVESKIQEKTKAEEEAKRQAEQQAKEEATKPISTDFTSFNTPYLQMTDLQRKDYFKTVKGKYVQWTGEVVNVDKGAVFVKCLDSTLTFDFTAFMSSAEKNNLANVAKGSTITIKGSLYDRGGELTAWSLHDCVIAK